MVIRKIYFDEALHRYTNEFLQPYTSTTTKIGEYEIKFSDSQNSIAEACERIGRSKPNHPNYLKYKGKSKKQILAEWDVTRDEGCTTGNIHHNRIEIGLKETTSIGNAFDTDEYKKENANHQKRLYTIDEVLANPDSGIVDVDKLDNGIMKAMYPKIYDFLKYIVSKGFRLYPELVGYDEASMICGCIDLPAIHPNGQFMIVDWKTNKAPMTKEAGYYNKDANGNLQLDKFIATPDKTFKFPLQHLQCSTYNKYGMQLSVYAKFLIDRGLVHIGNVIFHITHDMETEDEKYLGFKKVVVHNMPYLGKEVELMFAHSMLSQPQLAL